MGYLISVHFDDTDKFETTLQELDEDGLKKLLAASGVEVETTQEDEDYEHGSGRRHFEFKDGKSNKFWEVECKGASVVTWWGKIGTSGQTKTLNFETEAEAQQKHDSLVSEKCKKGYVEEGGGGTESLPTAVAEIDVAKHPRCRFEGMVDDVLRYSSISISGNGSTQWMIEIKEGEVDQEKYEYDAVWLKNKHDCQEWLNQKTEKLLSQGFENVRKRKKTKVVN